MGGQQAILSLTLIPAVSGVAFDLLGAPALYWIGSRLATLALLVAAPASRPEILPGRRATQPVFSEADITAGHEKKEREP